MIALSTIAKTKRYLNPLVWWSLFAPPVIAVSETQSMRDSFKREQVTKLMLVESCDSELAACALMSMYPHEF